MKQYKTQFQKDIFLIRDMVSSIPNILWVMVSVNDMKLFHELFYFLYYLKHVKIQYNNIQQFNHQLNYILTVI